MTATFPRAAHPGYVADVVGTPRLFAGLDRAQTVGAGGHAALHGRLPIVDRERLLGLLDGARLVGRGGAAFPVAAKLRATPAGAAVVVNGMESEPASRKDRTLMVRAPHLVLDGAVTLAAVLGSTDVVVAVADPVAVHALSAACNDRHDCGRVRVQHVPAPFTGGEARALLRRLSGGPSLAPGRRILPTVRGLQDRPTLLANAETVAQIAILVRCGVGVFGRTGEPGEPGTTLVTVTGAVADPAAVEIPAGLPVGALLRTAGAAPPVALVVGGYHGAWVEPDPTLRLSRRGLADVHGTFGAGVVAVVGHDTCGLGELARVTQWLADRSARQCGPCLNGLPALADTVGALYNGRADDGTTAALAAMVDGRGACAHPDGAVRFVRSGLRVLRDELAAHARGGCGRPVLGHLPLAATS